ncbi:MAG: carbohydrate ABC transporter substrate-binding protein [Anaerolineaceae bacterium]|nr:carbohydrate ABC transporter substrate-binding protein [Anaerolineaceae bacterium]
MRKSILTFMAILLILSFALTACQPAATEEPAPVEEVVEEVEEMEEEAPEAMDMPQGEELTKAYAGEYAGTVVTMAGPFTDADAVKFDNSIVAFEEATGIDIQYEGSKEFEASITIRVDGGDAPDIVDFPQPGLLANMVKKGQVVDLNDVIDQDWMKQNYIQSWLDMGTMAGPDGDIMAGVWARANGKSLVFYPKAEFDAAGYEVPETWDELMTLTETIASDGDTPWCIGMESGAATGWSMTDWIEDVMLRTTSLENYDKWVAGELPFDSPEVKKALSYITAIWFNDDYVYGGQASISTTSFGDAPAPMFDAPPKCWLHRQGNFITSFFPEDKVAGVDYDFFYLPPIDEQYGKPVLGAGDIYAMFNDRPEVRAVIQYFSTAESVKGWVEAGGAISPHNDSSLDWYADSVTRGVAEIILNADSFRFDASDLMPKSVGTGTFWKYMTDYVSGSIDQETALQQIDASWPADGAAPVEEEVEEEMEAGAKQGEELAMAFAGEYDGTVVTMAGPFTDADAVKFDNSIVAFEEATGIDIQYEGSKEFEASITIRVDGGDAPDIVDFPQPGLLANMVKKGQVVDLNDVIDQDWMKQNYIQSWLDMGTMAGPDGDIMAGVWARANGKSLVFYPKAEFDAAGYEVPETWDELMTLTETIASDGDTPWCIGMESGAATGWSMTDWIEDVMLRTTSLENYDKWVAGELPFDSPEVKKALSYITAIWFNDDYVYGGQASISTTSFGDAPAPMFDAPPKCWLHRQGNFITSFFPEDKVAGVDYDFFYLPPIDEQYGKPVLGAGDIYAMFNDRPEVRAVIQYFSTAESVKGWVEAGGAISPHNDSSLDWYADSVTRGVAEIILNADSFRFDASDLMPKSVGTGTFWKYMTDYVSGSTDEDTALQEIDASWPAE